MTPPTPTPFWSNFVSTTCIFWNYDLKKTENIFWMFPSNIFVKFTFRHSYVPPSNLGGYQWIIKISLKSTSLSTQPKVCFSTEWSQCIQLKYNDYNLCVLFSLMFHEDPSLVLYFFKSHEENWPRLHADLVTICLITISFVMSITTTCSHFLWIWDKIRKNKILKINLYKYIR